MWVVRCFFYMKAILFRTLVFTHRYVGIAVGWLMLLWCLSGLVMVYVSYPELREAERQAALNTLNLTQCCRVPQALFAPEQRISAVTVEMLVDRPVLRVQPEFGPAAFIDLRTGNAIEAIAPDIASAAARQYLPVGSTSTPQVLSVIERDQWTVYPRYDNARPLYHLALHDAGDTQVYVSSMDGKVVQKTTRMQRFWNWLGAVPHWLYFTALRQHAELWSQTVIWSSTVGCFLAVFGMYLGIWQLRRKSDGHLHSPYRGWKYWHHVPGLLFGVLVMTWVFSGLLSMTPWGWLESGDSGQEVQRIQGELPAWQNVHESLRQLSTTTLPVNTVHIASSIVQGKLHYLISTRDGARMRHDADWQIAPLSTIVQQQLAQQLVSAGQAELLTAEDDYWYSVGRDQVVLPVIRVRSGEGTRYYLDAISGELLHKMDEGARWYRWLHSGLHRMDFSPVMRGRPVRDLLMWLLLAGATVICATGAWLGMRRLWLKR